MSGQTKIEWATRVWNPLAGCQKVSEGCRNCYADELHYRRHKAYQEGKLQNIPQYAKPFNEIQLLEDRLMEPLKWKKPQRIFVNSMSDIFHKDVPTQYIRTLFEIMGAAEQHTFLILTKRPERMRDFIVGLQKENDFATLYGDTPDFPFKNIWLGVSVENEKSAKGRIHWLLKTPAAVRFLSCEPLLGPLDLRVHLEWKDRNTKNPLVDFVIVGGESGSKARPIHPDWVRDLRDQCVNRQVKFFFKQWGKHIPDNQLRGGSKKESSRLLDGREWNELPREGY